MTILTVIHSVAVMLSVVAGIGVLRNPLKTLLNFSAGLCYIIAAIAALWLKSWWPLAVGWVLSLSIQALMMWRLTHGYYNSKINSVRTAQGKHTLGVEADEGETETDAE